MTATICGMMVIRNGNSLGYPWLEAVQNVLPFVDRFLIGEGNSDDDTYEWCKRLADSSPKIHLMRQNWGQSSTGFAIGAVTNKLLAWAKTTGCDWIWNLQADELYHPRVAAAVVNAIRHDGDGRDGIEMTFLHLQDNFQEEQPGAGYQRAIRAVRNRPDIYAFRDAWTFVGCKNVVSLGDQFPVVHANRTYWFNVPRKLRSHADSLYPDLAHYRAAAEAAEGVLAASQDVVPEKWTRTISPYADLLPSNILPTIGWTIYRPREELTR